MLLGFPKSAQLQSSRSIIFQTKRNTQIGGHTIRFMICRKQYQSSVHWGLVLFSTYHETDRMPANLSVSLCLKYNAPAWLQLSTLWETKQQLFIIYYYIFIIPYETYLYGTKFGDFWKKSPYFRTTKIVAAISKSHLLIFM